MIGGPLATYAGDHGRVKGVALGAVPTLPRAHSFSLLGGGFFHGDRVQRLRLVERLAQVRGDLGRPFSLSPAHLTWLRGM